MLHWMKNRSSGLLIVGVVTLFILFSKEILSLFEFQISLTAVLILHFGVRSYESEGSLYGEFAAEWKSGVHGQTRVGVSIGVIIALLSQLAAYHPAVPELFAVGALTVAICGIVILSMMNIIESHSGLPSILTHE